MDDGIDLIGTPFKYGGRGPDFFDCYGLVMEMSRRAGKPLPDFGFDTNHNIVAAMMGATLPQWEEISKTPGCVALIRIGRLISHVGYLIDADHMIHSWDMSNGVSIVRLDEWKNRITGFYRYVG